MNSKLRPFLLATGGVLLLNSSVAHAQTTIRWEVEKMGGVGFRVEKDGSKVRVFKSGDVVDI